MNEEAHSQSEAGTSPGPQDKWQSQDLNPGLPIPESAFVTSFLTGPLTASSVLPPPRVQSSYQGVSPQQSFTLHHCTSSGPMCWSHLLMLGLLQGRSHLSL